MSQNGQTLVEPRVITLSDIKAAYERISPYIEKTPVLESRLINQDRGRRFFFKCENMQRTGSFKIRGAMNAVHVLVLHCDFVVRMCYILSTYKP